MTNIIEKTLIENIRNLNNIFVFPTQTACDLWADRLLSSGVVKAVAMERFTAWDDFKGNSIKSRQQNKKSIPSTMRKIFAANCIALNAEKPFLKSIIRKEYAKTAQSYTEWLSKLLPGLSMWKNRFTASGLPMDDEDCDLLEIHRLYSQFLEENRLFDPAWETPPFEADGHHYFIFFPEILSDYFEYREILASSPADITVINIPEEILKSKPEKVSFFSNSRAEIKSIALYLRKIHREQNIPWTEMAVSIPDMDTYGPYIQRELELFQIPYVYKNALPLTSHPAGNFFIRLKECAANNFNFESIKELLFNDALPWKSKEVINQLIEFGKANNCITSYKYKNKQVDVWEESFKLHSEEERALTFYRELKKKVEKLVKASTFTDLKNHYFEFRNTFFNIEECSEKSNLILSRCISELSQLIDLEKDFHLNQPDSALKLNDCFGFFTDVLKNKKYLPQTEKAGVSVMPYKLTACAPFDLQVVADSSQKGLSVVYQELSFLREDKRKKLFGNQEDSNVTELFIKLYQMNAMSGNVYFSAAGKTFDGYAQASSYLELSDYSKNDMKCSLFADDYFSQEKGWFTQKSEEFPETIPSISDQGFSFWSDLQKKSVSENISAAKAQADMAVENAYDSKVYISATSLKRFFQCPREWYLNKFSNLEEQINEAELFDHKTIGLLYHKFYEIFCNTLKEKNLPVHTTLTGMEENYLEIFNQSLEKTIQESELSFLARELLKTTSKSLNDELKQSVEQFMNYFEGCTVEETETEYEFNPPNKNYVCVGRIDCLLKDSQTGERILVDFKSFNSAIPEILYKDPDIPDEAPLEEQELPDLQMPMYCYLLGSQEFPKIIENCCFFQVSKGEITQVFGENIYSRIKAINPRKKIQMVSEEEYRPTMYLFAKTLERFTERMEQKDFSVNHVSQNYEKCNGCSNRAVCRRTFIISKQE